jgi:hypothetical protein
VHGHRFDDVAKNFVSLGKSRRAFLRWTGAMALAGLSMREPPRAGAVADAQCPLTANTGGFGRNRFGQTFKALNTGTLTQATVQVSLATPDNSADMLFEIRKTNRKGKPTATVLASVQVDNIVDPPSGTTAVTANFNPGAPVRKGKRYALVLTWVNGFAIVRVNDEGCPGALFEDDDNVGNIDNKFAKIPGGEDMVFSTDVTPA